ncbi:hypothetical protein ACRALDRAFT_1081989 [Sodiomyces alcalophilus JCM 7366]|uniref:uncharacterized protein n=1 Tax=Sodiomyces alcalophilus JCM 7366 TaxID=591952 RepID=UPI0039B6D6E4
MDQEPQQFQLVKKLTDEVWLATRTDSGEEFLAKRIDDFDAYFQSRFTGSGKRQRQAKGLMDLIYEHNIGRSISHVLNHENIVSLAGYLRQKPLNPKPYDTKQATDDYLVWDNCDAGFLELLLINSRGEKGRRKSYMPESLCWHVLTSVMRALAWLHDGYRPETNWDTGERTWMKTDTDWMPILHRDITATSIMFQHPRGEETYGTCKLGRFAKAFVSGQPADRHDQGAKDGSVLYSSSGQVLAPHANLPKGLKAPPDASAATMKKFWAEYTTGKAPDQRLYTISDEHWSLGAVLWRMMTATKLPSQDSCDLCENKCRHVTGCLEPSLCLIAEAEQEEGCRCLYAGCQHVQTRLEARPEIRPEHRRRCGHLPKWRRAGCDCPHGCPRPDVHIDDVLAQLDYSKFLVWAVRKLFDYDGEASRRGSVMLCTEIDAAYRQWRAQTKEGREYGTRRHPTMSLNTPTPPLLLTKRLTAFLNANLSSTLHAAFLTTASGKLLAHAATPSFSSSSPSPGSPAPPGSGNAATISSTTASPSTSSISLPAGVSRPSAVSLLRTQATVAASLFALHSASSTSIPGALPGSSSDSHPDHDALSGTTAASSTTTTTAGKKRNTNKLPLTITVQLSNGILVVRRLRCGLLFVCVGPLPEQGDGPAASSTQSYHAGSAPADGASSSAGTGTGASLSVPGTATPRGQHGHASPAHMPASPSEVDSVMSVGAATIASVASGGSSVAGSVSISLE